jgi:hypothetical protein
MAKRGSKAATTEKQDTSVEVKLRPVDVQRIAMEIVGVSPLVQHKWSEKALEMMRQKKAGKKTKSREACDPEAECRAATYYTADGGFGVPVTAVKGAIIAAAHKDLGVEKTLVRKSLFILCGDANGILPMTCDEPRIREDAVRVGMGSADLRYRPEFSNWSVPMEIEYDAGNLTPEDIVNLVNRAGFGVGIGEFRPEKGGEWGRFKVKEMAA